MKKKFYKTIWYKALEIMEDSPSIFTDIFSKNISEVMREAHDWPAKGVRGTIRELEKKLLVTRHKKGRKTIFKVTPTGKKYLLIGTVLKNFTEKAKNRKWDGKWRVVIFDVPEEKRWIRDFLRRELLSNRFYQLQKSVWITPYKVAEDLEQLFEEIGASDFARYMIVEYINNEKDLIKHFKLARR